MGVNNLIKIHRDKLINGFLQIYEDNLKVFDIIKCVKEIDLHKYNAD
jgi:hypothetical protein